MPRRSFKQAPRHWQGEGEHQHGKAHRGRTNKPSHDREANEGWLESIGRVHRKKFPRSCQALSKFSLFYVVVFPMKWKIQTPSGPQAPYLSAMGWLPSGDQVFYTIKQSREWKYEVSKEIRVAKDIEDVATAISEAEKDLTDSGGQSLH